MSNTALTWANSLPRVLPNGVKLTPACRAVLKQLADYADSEWQCYPSHQRLVEDTFFHPATVVRALNRLEEAGVISRRVDYYRGRGRNDDPRQGQGGGRKGTLYTLLPDASSVAVIISTTTADDLADEQLAIRAEQDRRQQADEKLGRKMRPNFSEPRNAPAGPVDNSPEGGELGSHGGEKLHRKMRPNFSDPRNTPAEPVDNSPEEGEVRSQNDGSYIAFPGKLGRISGEVTSHSWGAIKEEPSKEPSREPENNDPREARDAAVAAGPAGAVEPVAESKSEADAFLERLSPELSMEKLDSELESRLGRRVSGVWWPDVAQQVLAAATGRVMHPAAYVAGCVAREPYRWGVDLGPAPERPASLDTPTVGGTPAPSRYSAAADPDLGKHLVTVDELPAEVRAQLHGQAPAATARPAGAPDAPPGSLPHLSDTTIV